MLLRSVLSLGLLAGMITACGTQNAPQSSEVAGFSDSVASHKSPKNDGKNYPTQFFLVKTTDRNLLDSYSSVIKTLTPKNPNDNMKTLVPGTYKIQLKKGEYIFTGSYWHYEQFGSGLPPYDNFIGGLYTIENGKLVASTGGTLSLQSSQSDFVAIPSPAQFMPNGVSEGSIDVSKFKISVSGDKLIVDFPQYTDGRSF